MGVWQTVDTGGAPTMNVKGGGKMYYRGARTVSHLR